MPAAPTTDAGRRRTWLRVVCGAAVLLNTTGCMTWRAVPPATEPSRTDATYDRARIVLRDSTQRDLRDVVVRPDSVIGFADPEHTRVAVAQADVARVETRRLGVGRTIGLVAGAVAVLALVALISVVRAFGEGFTAAPSPAPSVP